MLKTKKSIKELQSRLKSSGLYTGKIDGDYGPLTTSAVIKFQARNLLFPDGIVGPATMKHIQTTEPLKTDPTKITYDKFVASAKRLKCEPAILMALALKETRGEAFVDGRLKILFEPHIMRRELVKRSDPTEVKQYIKKYPDVVTTKPLSNYGNLNDQYRRFEVAKSICKSAAHSSISMGKFQIMGFNYAQCGYSSPGTMYTAACKSEAAHLVMLERFITGDVNLLSAMQRLEFKVIAKIYNGPGYRKNDYDTDLIKYFELIKDALA